MMPLAEDAEDWKLQSRGFMQLEISESRSPFNQREVMLSSVGGSPKGIKKQDLRSRSSYNKVTPIRKLSHPNEEGLFSLLQPNDRDEIYLLDSDSKGTPTPKPITEAADGKHSGLFRRKTRQSESLRRWKLVRNYCTQLKTKWR